jgi:hypothetical protein
MTMMLLTENECAWIEFIRLISGDTDPVPDLISVQTLRLALRRKPSDLALHRPTGPDFRNQGSPFPSSASADPTIKKWTATAFSAVARSRRRLPSRDEVREDGEPRD